MSYEPKYERKTDSYFSHTRTRTLARNSLQFTINNLKLLHSIARMSRNFKEMWLISVLLAIFLNNSNTNLYEFIFAYVWLRTRNPHLTRTEVKLHKSDCPFTCSTRESLVEQEKGQCDNDCKHNIYFSQNFFTFAHRILLKLMKKSFDTFLSICLPKVSL